MNTPLRHSGMVRALKGSQFYLHTTHSSANGMNHTMPSQPKLVVIYLLTQRRMEG